MLSRRTFLQALSAAPLATALAERRAAEQPRDRAILANEAEPGERLIVTGVVLMPDGRTPAAGVQLTSIRPTRADITHGRATIRDVRASRER